MPEGVFGVQTCDRSGEYRRRHARGCTAHRCSSMIWNAYVMRPRSCAARFAAPKRLTGREGIDLDFADLTTPERDWPRMIMTVLGRCGHSDRIEVLRRFGGICVEPGGR